MALRSPEQTHWPSACSSELTSSYVPDMPGAQPCLRDLSSYDHGRTLKKIHYGIQKLAR